MSEKFEINPLIYQKRVRDNLLLEKGSSSDSTIFEKNIPPLLSGLSKRMIILCQAVITVSPLTQPKLAP